MSYVPITKASYDISDAINSQLCITKCFSLFGKVYLVYKHSFLFALYAFISIHFLLMGIHFYSKLSCNLLDLNFEKATTIFT